MTIIIRDDSTRNGVIGVIDTVSHRRAIISLHRATLIMSIRESGSVTDFALEAVGPVSPSDKTHPVQE